MKNLYYRSCMAGFVLLVFSCAVQRNAEPPVLMSDARLLHDVSVLASDSFKGRKPFSVGETLTVDYLVNEFQKIGLKPGNGNSYVQDVPLVEIMSTADSVMHVSSAQESFDLCAPRQYVLWADRTVASVNLENTPVVFAGYGVVAPEHGWNDYAGLDVKGKIVMVMVNDPGFWNGDTTLFKGRTMTYYGRWTYKFEEAARQGARGCLVIHRPSAAGYSFRVVQNNFNTSRMQLDDRIAPEKKCDVTGWITDTAATKLLLAAGFDSTLFVKANQRGFRGMTLPVKISTKLRAEWKYNVSKNVMAKLEGTRRPGEVIMYTAHWDHLGIGKPDETSDSIYNGALDNATGTAGLLELARAFRSLKKAPERSVVFLSTTAEEQGLLGSQHYASNPVYPPGKTVAVINMDVLNTYGPTKDMVIVGRGQSELEDYLDEAAQKSGGYVVQEARPETGSYFRSDHFPFAKIGIPALYAGSGTDIIGMDRAAGAKLRDEYTAKHYHRPSDEVDTSVWKLQGAIRDLGLLFEVGRKLSMEKRWPQWKKGSEFSAARK